jgi:hypothetical protein
MKRLTFRRVAWLREKRCNPSRKLVATDARRPVTPTTPGQVPAM